MRAGTDGCVNHIVADNDGHAGTHAHGSALGDADTAGPDGHLALVRRLNSDLMGGNAGFVADLRLGFRAADQHRDCSADRCAAGTGYRAGDCLRRQQSVVLAGGVLGQVGLHVHVTVFAGQFGRISHQDIRLVAVHADRHARGDGGCAVGKGHGNARAQGTEVSFVTRQDVDAFRGVNLAGNFGIDFVFGDGQAHCGSNLHAAALRAAIHAQVLVAGIVRLGAGFADVVICTVGPGLVTDVLGPQDVGGQGCAGIRLFAVFFVAVFIQLAVNAVSGLVFLLVVRAAAVGFIPVLPAQNIFCFSRSIMQLVNVTLHIGAHSGCNGVGFVFAAAAAGNMGRALFQGCGAFKAHIHAGADDIDRHSGADSRALAHGEAARPGNGIADLISRQYEIGLLALVPGFVFRFFSLFNLDAVFAVSGDGRVLPHAGGNSAVQNIQRHRSIDRNIRRSVLAFLVDGIGTGNSGSFRLPVGLRPDCQGIGINNAAFAQRSLGIYFPVVEGESCAHADGASLAVGIGSLRIRRSVLIRCFQGHSALRHIEDIGGFVVGGMVLDHDLFFFIIIGIGQLVQNLSCLVLHRYLNQVLIGRLRAVPILDFDGNVTAGRQSDSVEDRIKDNVPGNLRLLVQVGNRRKAEHAVGTNGHFLGLLISVLIGIAVADLLRNGIALIRRQLNLTAVLFHLTAGRGHEIMIALAQYKAVPLAAGLFGFRLAGAFILVRFSVRIQGAGGCRRNLLVVDSNDVYFPVGFNRSILAGDGAVLVRDVGL